MTSKVERARLYTTEYRDFAGLSDRSPPLGLQRYESPDLRNVEFSERTLKCRNGWRRVHSNRMRDCSIRFDGVDDYIRIPHQTAYNPGSTAQLVTFDVVLRTFPAAEVVLLSKGTGTGSSRFFRLSYDPTLNSNNGGWKIIAYDATGAALRTFTVNDGVGSTGGVPVNFYRHISLTCTTYATRTYTMSVYDSAGTLIGASSTAVVNWISSTDPWIVGSDTSSSGFAFFTGAELRLRIHDGSFDAVTATLIVDRELTATEAATMTGYWKMNDGQGSRIADSTSTANYGTAEVEGPAWLGAWNGNQSYIVGRSGLGFYGGAGHVHWKPASGLPAYVFNSHATYGRKWALSFVWTPILDAGETAVRSQTLFWTGTNTTDPGPIGVVVESVGGSQRLVAKYRDGTNVKSATLTGLSLTSASAVIGRRMRIVVLLGNYGPGERIEIQARSEAASTIYVASTATDGANPGVLGNDWSVGRVLTSFAHPQTFSGSSAFAILDDFAIFRGNTTSSNPPLFPIPNAPLWPWSSLQAPSAGWYLVAGLPLDEGYGNVLITTGGNTNAADLYPEEEQGLLWDEGIVEPYESVEARLAVDFNRIDAGGKVVRRKVVVSGTTLYEVDLDAALARAVRGNIHKGGKLTSAQYGDKLFIAGPNGKRPRVYNGINLDWVGIRAPFQTPVPVAGGAGTGSLGAGTYHVYVTYRSAATGAESNPSPVASFTAAALDKIDSIQLPVSADPQVDQRRVWLTVANGGAGSTAYLVATVEDNVTVNYTTDITSISLTAATLTYTGNDEAPLGSIVEVFKDRLFVSGNPTEPTYVWYSSPGTLTSFNYTENFEDLDLDSGDVVTALKGLRDYIVAHSRDGRTSMTPTGSLETPFYVNRLSRDAGAVAPLAVLEFESTHVYAGERDAWIWDGSQSLNITSPNDPARPSIQTLWRDGLNRERMGEISLAFHRARNQLWFSCASNGSDYNDTVLVYSWDQGKWSRYDLDVDLVASMEDSNDDPWIFGVHQGFLALLDYGRFDGTSRTISQLSAIVSSGTTTTVTTYGGNWTTNEFKGLWCFYLHSATEVLDKVRIASNTVTALTFYDALSATAADGDVLIVCGLEFWAEFNLNMADPMTTKRLRYLMLRLTSTGDSAVRLVVDSNNLGRQFDPTDGTSYVREVTSATSVLRVNLGGTGGNFRIRIGDTSYIGDEAVPWLPGFAGQIDIQAMDIESEVMPARLS